MPKGKNEDLLLFIVPKAHWVTTLNGCHRDAGHQSCDTHSALVVGILLVARNDQSDVTIHQDLCAFFATWGQLIEGFLTPFSGHCFSRHHACRFYQHRDGLGAEQVILLGVDFSYCWINLEVLKYSLEQHIGFAVRLAFNYYCSLHQVWTEAEN